MHCCDVRIGGLCEKNPMVPHYMSTGREAGRVSKREIVPEPVLELALRPHAMLSF